MINAVGREIPEKIGDYVVKPYTGAYTTVPSDAPVHTLRTAGKHSMCPETRKCWEVLRKPSKPQD
ncbi:MAG: hypothetical protein MR528_02185 [Lachnospiraceae bacterium]|nr:hypothetical protein [Lachnospiraceae bacterium]